MAPFWVRILADASLGVAFVCTLIILYDMFVAGNRQQMPVMAWVWPVTALYWGPIGLWIYFTQGRKRIKRQSGDQRGQQQDSPGHENQDQAHPDQQHRRVNGGDTSNGRGPGQQKDPTWDQVAISVGHCGAGCTLGDIVGEWVVFWAGFTILGNTLGGDYVLDLVLAWGLGIIFQYFAIVPMRKLSPAEGIIAAVKADTLSILAFEVGLFGWMALAHYILFKPPTEPSSSVHWFMMQVGMVIGFFTSYPVNIWLIRKGFKEAM